MDKTANFQSQNRKKSEGAALGQAKTGCKQYHGENTHSTRVPEKKHGATSQQADNSRKLGEKNVYPDVGNTVVVVRQLNRRRREQEGKKEETIKVHCERWIYS